MDGSWPVARGRHAPPPEVRLALQRERLLQAAAAEVVQEAMARAARRVGPDDALGRLRAATRAFLTALAEHRAYAQTLLVEIIGAGPEAARRRDQILQDLAPVIDRMIAGVLAPRTP